MKQPSRKTAMWFAAQTRYRCEKAVFRTLGKKRISSYLPLVRTSRTYGARRRIIECPLFLNYIFVHITRSDYLKVLQTNHLVDFIFCKLYKWILDMCDIEAALAHKYTDLFSDRKHYETLILKPLILSNLFELLD